MGTRSFVIKQNIERYRQLLKTATDAQEREVIRRLLAEAEADRELLQAGGDRNL